MTTKYNTREAPSSVHDIALIVGGGPGISQVLLPRAGHAGDVGGPVFHIHAHKFISLLFEQSCGYGGIDPPTHANVDGFHNRVILASFGEIVNQ